MASEIWALRLAHKDPEEWAHHLFEHGALGFEFHADGMLDCYLRGDAAACAPFREKAESFGFTFVSLAHTEDRNWVQECSEILKPVLINRLSINAVRCSAEKPETQQSPGDIYIVPGSGFGTGHHESTRLALELLQNEVFTQVAPKRVLDIGTGSGILAIAANKLYGSTAVAIDNDSFALENADSNVLMNGCAANIALLHGSMEKAQGLFDLILANIYVEVLCSFEPRFEKHLVQHGFLILSGIKSAMRSKVEEGFNRSRWRFHITREESSWVALLLEKR